MLNQPEEREVVLIDVRDSVEIKVTGYTHIDPPPNKNQAIAAVRDIERLRAHSGRGD